MSKRPKKQTRTVYRCAICKQKLDSPERNVKRNEAVACPECAENPEVQAVSYR